jgi:hypothetical protein
MERGRPRRAPRRETRSRHAFPFNAVPYRQADLIDTGAANVPGSALDFGRIRLKSNYPAAAEGTLAVQPSIGRPNLIAAAAMSQSAIKAASVGNPGEIGSVSAWANPSLCVPILRASAARVQAAGRVRARAHRQTRSASTSTTRDTKGTKLRSERKRQATGRSTSSLCRFPGVRCFVFVVSLVVRCPGLPPAF